MTTPPIPHRYPRPLHQEMPTPLPFAETEVPTESQLENALDDYTRYHTFESDEPGYSAEATEAFNDTGSMLAEGLARHAAADINNFNYLRQDIADEAHTYRNLPDDDPDKQSLGRRVEVRARGFLPPYVEATTFQPEYAVATDHLKRQVDTLITGVEMQFQVHASLGDEAMAKAIPGLMELAKEGMAPYIRKQLEDAVQRSGVSVAQLRAEATDLRNALVGEQHNIRRTHDAAVAKEGSPVPEPEGPGLLKRAAQAAAATVSETAAYRQELRREDAQDDARKQHEREITDAWMNLPLAERDAALAAYKANRKVTEGLHASVSANYLKKLSDLLVDPVDDSHSAFVTELAGATPAPGPEHGARAYVEWAFTTARPDRMVRVDHSVDPNADVIQIHLDRVRETLRRNEGHERGVLISMDADPDRQALLFGRAEQYSQQLRTLDERIDKIIETREPSTNYRGLYENRRSLCRILAQANYLYTRAVLQEAPLNGSDRDFQGRFAARALSDGGILMRDQIFWPNGDVGVVPEAGDEDVAATAYSYNTNGRLVDQGQFVRLASNGAVRRPHDEALAPDSRATDLNRRRLAHRDSLDLSDAYQLAEAARAYDEARAEFILSDPTRARNAEQFRNEINIAVGVSLYQNSVYLREAGLNHFLNRDLIIAGRRQEINDRQAAGQDTRQLENDLRTFAATTDAYGREPANWALINAARVDASHLARLRYEALQTGIYEGTTRIGQNGEIVLNNENTPRNQALRQFVGLPAGEWRFMPDGSAVHVVTPPGRGRPAPRLYFYAPDRPPRIA